MLCAAATEHSSVRRHIVISLFSSKWRNKCLDASVFFKCCKVKQLTAPRVECIPTRGENP
jgi:hypothetical protein